MYIRSRALTALILASLGMLVACTTMGSGYGTVRDARTPVNFDWRSSDDVSGTLTAKLADGQVFSGQYFQITSDVRFDRLEPLWAGWHRSWRGWPYWYAEAGPDFGTYYSGRMLANLHATDGSPMRCRFDLVHPARGVAGGAHGTCQHPDGKTIDASLGPVA
jgi:hypothetical protein